MLVLWRDTAFMRAFGILKIPLVAYIKPSVARLDEEGLSLKVPLLRRNRNHLGSMYFGALAIGADLCGAFLAIREILFKKLPINFVFKDMSAQFLKRAEGDVLFISNQRVEIIAALNQAMATGERVNIPLAIKAVLAKDQADVVATFTLTLSVKRRKEAA